MKILPIDPSAAPEACGQCASGTRLGFDFSYAYQPIVDVHAREVFAHEALVRGPAGESAFSVLDRVTEENRYKFDQACRVKAIRIAATQRMSTHLSINFLPNAVYRPDVCIRTTLDAARTHAFPIDRIIFETTEGERIADGAWFAEVLREYQRIGFLTAIDDFGAGFAGLNLLADFQPDIVKLDMGLVRGIDTRRPAQIILRGIVDICRALNIRMVAEGIETIDEYLCLEASGITLMQGYLFGRPVFEGCTPSAAIPWPTVRSGTSAQESVSMSADDPFAGVALR